MRVARSIRERVVLPMDCNPLPPALSRREPEHRPEAYVHGGMHPDRAVCEAPVEIDRRGDDGDLGKGQSDERGDPDIM
jgi:hypothetical protein